MKLKKHRYVLTITFSGGVSTSKESQQEIVGKIASALRHEAEAGQGIAPDESQEWTKEITVRDMDDDTQATEKLP